MKPEELLIEDAKRQVEETETRLTSIEDAIQEINRMESDAEADAWHRIKSMERIYDFWRGVKASNYVEESISECQDNMKILHNKAEIMRSDLNTEARHLCQRRETLLEDINRMKKMEGDKEYAGRAY